MGIGSLSDGKFDLVVVADHLLDDQSRITWIARFFQASRALFDATEGQLQFGRVFFSDDSFGLGAAEFVLHEDEGRAFATVGGYGQAGQRAHLFSNSSEKTIVHEFGHHAFYLYDEYTSEVWSDRIDTNATPPAAYSNDPPLYNEVPLIESDLPSQDLEFARAIIRFGNVLVDAIVQSHTPTLLTVFGSYPANANPMESSNGVIFYQQTDGITCGTGQNDIHSIMAESNDAQITEFCTASNHDPSGTNAHSVAYGGLSCWEVMREKMLRRWGFPLAIPDPEAQSGPDDQSPNFEPATFFDLVKEGRFVLVMDRSGSMAEDGKIVGAQFGVELWLEFMSELGDFLSVIWYDENIDVRLPLSELTDATDLQSVVEATNDVVPQGFTNIRDALFAAHQEITSREDRAAIQGVILLTDGIHNRPIDTSPLEVVPTFQDAGIPILGIALGEPDHIDFETLEELCTATGGGIQAVSAFPGYDSSDEQSIIGTTGTAVGLASALLRNGLSVFGDLEIGAEDSVAATMSRRGKSKTKLQNLAEALEFEDAADLLQRRRIAGGSVVRFHVEAGADWTLFAAVYREKEDLELILVDPEGYVVDYEGSQSILMESASPLKNAIVKKPKPGVWKAVLARKTKGTAFKVYYYAQVENRRIAVHGEVAPLVPIGQTAVIHASATWKDLLSDLDVEARIRDPEGGLHMVSLSDKKYAEPNSGDYVGTFVPELPGRHSVELKISCRGNATLGGSIHRLLHGPAPSAKKAETFDIAAGAPAFIRRVPLYFDAGKRPIPVDNDDKSGGRIQFPVKPRKAALRPLNLQRVLKRSGANKSSSSAKQKRKKSQTR